MKVCDLLEMAKPTSSQLEKTYYHGTPPSVESTRSILKNGIKPPEIDITKKTRSSYNLTPVEGKVYLTPEIAYAQIYALGGDVAGSSYMPKGRDVGFVFSISGKELLDIQPDEDSIGEMIRRYLHMGNKDNTFLNRMTSLARDN